MPAAFFRDGKRIRIGMERRAKPDSGNRIVFIFSVGSHLWFSCQRQEAGRAEKDYGTSGPGGSRFCPYGWGRPYPDEYGAGGNPLRRLYPADRGGFFGPGGGGYAGRFRICGIWSACEKLFSGAGRGIYIHIFYDIFARYS